MDIKYSFQFITTPKCNIAAIREAYFENNKIRNIILLIMLAMFLIMTVYDAFNSISGIWKIIYVILLVISASHIFLFKSEYDNVKMYFNKNSGNTYRADIYENKIVLEKISQDDNPKDPVVIDFSNGGVIAKNHKNYLLINCSQGFSGIPKEALSEADKQALSSLAQRINASHKKGKNKAKKSAEGSGQ